MVTREIRSMDRLEARKNCKCSQMSSPCEITNNQKCTRFKEDPSKNRNLFVGH